LPDLATPANQQVQAAIDVGDLEEPRVTQFREQSFDVEFEASGGPGFIGQPDPFGVHHTSAYRGLQTQLISVEGSCRRTAGPRLLCSARDVAHGSQIRLQFQVI
jgi:hypothetical protein